MQIRKIKPQHKTALIELSKSSFGEESWTEKQLEDAITDDNYICIGLLDGDEMLSYLIAVQTLDDINIVSIATKRQHQRCGYASMLIKWMINLCFILENVFLVKNLVITTIPKKIVQNVLIGFIKSTRI